MPTACIQTAGAAIHLESEHLNVRIPDEHASGGAETRIIPLRDLDRLILARRASISNMALGTLLERGVAVSLMNERGEFLGSFLPATRDHAAFRLAQYRRTLDPEFVLQQAGRIVAAKIYNQRRVIQRMAANRKSPSAVLECGENPQGAAEVPALLDAMLARAGKCANLDELRGVEGAAAATYFQAWAGFFPSAFPFQRRSTRPPLNPPNACLSFIATMLYHEAHAFLHAHGLDPGLGLLHTTENGRWSLALDLIEPFRAVVAEALTLDLFSHRMLGNDHFEPKNGGIYLNEHGRRKLILQYEKRMDRQFMSESVGHRTTLRQQLENQALLYKSSLDQPDRFDPFLMN